MDREFPAYRFDAFRIDLKTRELERDGRRVRLAEKPFLVLLALLERPGELVSRDELRRRLWSDGTAVDFDNNLNSAVATLREQLSDSARRPRLVETLPRLGYRFLGDVHPEVRAAAPTASPRLGIGALGAIALALLLGVGALLQARGFERPAAPAVPRDPAALAAYQQGVYLLGQRTPGSLAEAVNRLTDAARLDPGFAPAHAARADALAHSAFAAPDGIRESMTLAREAAQRALSIDPRLATSRRVLATAALHLDWDVEEAGRQVELALSLDPQDGKAHLTKAALMSALGRHDDAVTHARRAVALDPSSNLVRADLGYFLLAAERYAEAREASQVALVVEPDFEPALRFLLVADERLGRLDEAADAAGRIMRLAGAAAPAAAAAEERLRAYRRWEFGRASTQDPDRASALRLALAHASLGERQRALESLERAYADREPFLVYLAAYPQFQSLHGDPRFEALRERMGVVTRTGS